MKTCKERKNKRKELMIYIVKCYNLEISLKHRDYWFDGLYDHRQSAFAKLNAESMKW